MKDLIPLLKKKNPDLKEAEIGGVLYIIQSKEHLTNSKLIQMTGLPKPVLAVFKSTLADLLAKSSGEEIVLNEKGHGVLSELDLRPYKWTLLYPETGELEQRLSQLRDKYELNPKREYDQFLATPGSSLGKAKMLLDKGLIAGRNLALIGDDDLVSAAIGLMSSTYVRIKVFDIDERVLGVIKKAGEDINMKNLEVQRYDCRNPLPSGELGKYDVVITDPPYTKAAAQLFLYRSLQLLKRSPTYEGGYILFNFGAGFKNGELEVKLQEIISNFGLVIEDKLNKYTRYEGAETIGSASSLYVLRTTPHTSFGEMPLPTRIYTFDKVEEEKFPYTDHFTFKISRVPVKTINSKAKMQKICGDFCRMHGLKVVNTIIDRFRGGGLSLTFILSTSNLLVHTWPEKGAVHMDLLTCAPIKRKAELGNTLAKLFETKQVETRCIE